MSAVCNRRQFGKAVALGVAANALPAWGARNLKIGHTGITWVDFGGPGGSQVSPEGLDTTFREIGGLGFYGIELFSWQIQQMEDKGGLAPLIEKYKLPLISAYGGPNLMDTAKRSENIANAIAWGKLLKKYGGTVVTIGPNGVRRNAYNFQENKANIVATLNEYCKALADIGLTGCVHQHTGTCIETREETYAVMETVDSRYVKFGPDIGQLQKGGVDPVQVVKDFLPIIQHMHLKDFSGGEHWLGYTPLGQGKVNLPAVLDMMDGKQTAGMVMVELDSSRGMPQTAGQAATVARDYLAKQGVEFRKG